MAGWRARRIWYTFVDSECLAQKKLQRVSHDVTRPPSYDIDAGGLVRKAIDDRTSEGSAKKIVEAEIGGDCIRAVDRSPAGECDHIGRIDVAKRRRTVEIRPDIPPPAEIDSDALRGRRRRRRER